MADIRFTLDAHQLRLVAQVVDLFLREEPRGEAQWLMHSIAETLAVRLGKRLAERRLEHKFILPVHQGLALRHLCMAGIELHGEGRERDELRRALAIIDQVSTRYIHIR
jgi:hypothetical protein